MNERKHNGLIARKIFAQVFTFEWLKVESEKEVVNRKALRQAKTLGQSSVKYFVDGLLDKSRLIDYDTVFQFDKYER